MRGIIFFEHYYALRLKKAETHFKKCFVLYISGGWPLGFSFCEVVGFTTTVLTTCSNWMLAIATIER